MSLNDFYTLSFKSLVDLAKGVPVLLSVTEHQRPVSHLTGLASQSALTAVYNVCVIVNKCKWTNGGVAVHDTMQMTSLYGLIFQIISHMCSIFVGTTHFVKLYLSKIKNYIRGITCINHKIVTF